jgi:hypothetical protein
VPARLRTRLDPVEQIWNDRKDREIADPCAANLAEVGDLGRRRLRSMPRRPKGIPAFWQPTQLAPYNCHALVRVISRRSGW